MQNTIRFIPIITPLQIIILIIIINFSMLFADVTQTFNPNGNGSRFPISANGRLTTIPELNAYQLINETIQVDGKLDDPAWSKAENATGFREWDPNRGEVSIEETSFKIAYDNEALYVAVACFEKDVNTVTNKLCRRDQISNSDFVGVYIDPYYDRTTAYNFMVNPSGVMGDRYVYGDGNMDPNWNGIWEAKVSSDEDGWYIEYRIPFSCLRYRPSEDMTWGLNVYRFMFGRGKDNGWTVWDKEKRGFVSRFGELKNLKDIPQTRQLELTPYFVHRTTDPYNDSEFNHYDNFGADLKWGVTPNLTLSATFQPDFGQVEADPTELNLSPFETHFIEKRPFFVEGAQYFWHPDFNMFYSRRIGTGDENSRIRTAGKLLGKTESGISIAGLYASTDIASEGQAHNSFKNGTQSSHYFFTRVGKEFNDGAHRINFAQSAVFKPDNRDEYGNYDSRDGMTTGADFDFNFMDRAYNVHGSFIGSIIDPAPSESDPDLSHGKIYGTGGVFKVSKLDGNFKTGLIGRWESKYLDLNDVGYLSAPDEIDFDYWASYYYNPSGKSTIFNQASFETGFWRRWLYGSGDGYDHDTGELIWSYGRGYPKKYGGRLESWMQFQNYWELWTGINAESEIVAKYETRTFDGERGPLMRLPSGISAWLGGNTDYRKRYQLELNLSGNWNNDGGARVSTNASCRWNTTDALRLTMYIGNIQRHYNVMHLENFANPGSGIGGVSYVFAELDQRIVNMTLRSDILFTRDLSLQLYAQPFITVGDYSNPRELKRPNSYDLEPPDGLPDFDVDDYDFRYAAVNFNAVLRWEFMRGSTFYIVWKHERITDIDRSDTTDPDEFSTSLDAADLTNNQPTNVILMKISYWLAL